MRSLVQRGIFAAACAVSALGCSTKSDSNGAAASAATKPPIVIGATAPLTGDQKDLGVLVQNALRVAEASLNSVGGILGRPVSVVIKDDGSDAAITSSVADHFFKPENAIVGLVGPSTTSGTLAIQDRFHAAQKPVITPLALSPELSTIQAAGDRYLFRTEPSAALQARAAALFLTRDVTTARADGTIGKGCKSVAIVHYNDDSGTGRPVAAEFKRVIKPLGGAVVLELEVDPNQKTFDTETARVVASSADCQAVLMLAAPGAQYMRSFKAAAASNSSRDWSKFATLGAITFFQKGFIANARKNPADDTERGAAEGVYGTAIDPEPDNPEYAGFKNIYDTYYPLSSNPRIVPPPAAVFDAVVLMALAVQRAGSDSDGPTIRDSILAVSRGGAIGASAKRFGPAALSDAIATLTRGEEIDYQGASGACDLDERGDVTADHVIWHIENNQFVTLKKIKASEIAQ